MKTCPHCGGVLEKKPRSGVHHNRLFGVINAAYHHWPEAYEEFQPDNIDHLRAWLLCKAGYRTTTTIPMEYDEPSVLKLAILATEQAIKAAGAYAFVRPHGNALAVIAAKSLKFEKLSQRDFAPLAGEIDSILENIFGFSTQKLLEEHKRAA